MEDRIKVRYIQIIGWERSRYKYWNWNNKVNSCWHRTNEVITGTSTEKNELTFNDSEREFAELEIKTVCKLCGATPDASEEISMTGSIRPKYNTETGRPEPGDGYYADYMTEQDLGWSENKRRVAIIILPNGVEWNLNSRANNCGSPEDNTHRCWCITGSLEDGTINSDGKNCHTCNAGAGSIQGGDYHGYLRNGYLCKE